MPDARQGRDQWRVRGAFLIVVWAAAAALIATLVTSPAAQADADDAIGTFSMCDRAKQAFRKVDVDNSEIFAKGVVVIGDWTVEFHDTRWRARHDRINLNTRAFHSAAWLIPDSRDDVGPAIDLFVEQARVNRDPGAGVGQLALKTRGWIESHVTWRMKTGLCLYQMADDQDRERLLPALEQLIDANLDPYRYYGPPMRPAHNHGLMADRELVNAARVLKRDDLADMAVQRLSLQQEQMYGPCGLMYEQANAYQYLHKSLWAQIQSRIPRRAQSLDLARTIDRIKTAAYALTFPDGELPVIGDGKYRVVNDKTLVDKNLKMLCPTTGWYSHRVVDARLTQQVIARFGPATSMHGHSDKGSLVWWVGRGQEGIPVIADRGMGRKTRPEELTASRAVSSHSAFDWADVADRDSRATLTRLPGGGQRLAIRGDRVKQGRWVRTITYAKSRAAMTIKDRVSSDSPAGVARSYLPLDPAWKATSKAGVFTTSEGARVRITCSTSSGRNLRMESQQVVDYQQAAARDAFTVMCQVPDARKGITMKIQVSLA